MDTPLARVIKKERQGTHKKTNNGFDKKGRELTGDVLYGD